MTANPDYYEQCTNRLRLRKMIPEDVDIWQQFFVNNPMEHFIGMDTSLPNREKSELWVNMQLKRYAENQFGHLAAIDKQMHRLIGVGGLIPREIDDYAGLEIAYSVMPEFWGKGYATEIAIHLKNYVFTNKICDSLISIINVENEPSKSVARNNAMTKWKTSEFHGMKVDVFKITND